MNRRPTTKKWILVNVILPLIPFIVGGTIRLIITSLQPSWNTFSASEMAICLALLSFFVNQSLVRTERILDNKDKQSDIETETMMYLVFGCVFLVLFTAITALSSIIFDLDLGIGAEKLVMPLHIFEVLVFASAPFLVAFSIQTQRSYRLKASIT